MMLSEETVSNDNIKSTGALKMTVLKKNKKFSGDLLHNRRIRLAITLRELARKLGISITAISRWESNAYAPRPKAMLLLAKILKVKPEYFYAAPSKN